MRKAGNNPPRAKKSLGQNFLVDARYVSKVVAAVGPKPGGLVFEIGPGRGALTERLLESGADVVAIELDRGLIAPLRTRFADRPKLHVIELDALKAYFPDIFHELNFETGKLSSIKLAANLPYYISTAILQHLSRQREFFSEMVLMFQREVVDRIAAKPGSSARGYLTVLVESAFDVEKLFNVPPEAFRPAPKVWSSVVRLKPKPSIPEEKGLQSLLSAAFAQKRKTIENNLKARYPHYAAALAEAGIDPKCRAEDLTLEEWLRLNAAILVVG